jgi:hypothetical protein
MCRVNGVPRSTGGSRVNAAAYDPETTPPAPPARPCKSCCSAQVDFVTSSAAPTKDAVDRSASRNTPPLTVLHDPQEEQQARRAADATTSRMPQQCSHAPAAALAAAKQQAASKHERIACKRTLSARHSKLIQQAAAKSLRRTGGGNPHITHAVSPPASTSAAVWTPPRLSAGQSASHAPAASRTPPQYAPNGSVSKAGRTLSRGGAAAVAAVSNVRWSSGERTGNTSISPARTTQHQLAIAVGRSGLAVQMSHQQLATASPARVHCTPTTATTPTTPSSSEAGTSAAAVKRALSSVIHRHVSAPLEQGGQTRGRPTPRRVEMPSSTVGPAEVVARSGAGSRSHCEVVSGSQLSLQVRSLHRLCKLLIGQVAIGS